MEVRLVNEQWFKITFSSVNFFYLWKKWFFEFDVSQLDRANNVTSLRNNKN